MAEQRKWGELGGRNHVCLGSSYVFVRATNTYEEPTYRATSGAPRGRSLSDQGERAR